MHSKMRGTLNARANNSTPIKNSTKKGENSAKKTKNSTKKTKNSTSCSDECNCSDCRKNKLYALYPPDRKVVGRLIGGGTFGRVYAHAQHEQLAVKYIVLRKELETSLIECGIMRSLDHPGLIRATEIKIDTNGLYIIMPRAAHDLKYYIERGINLSEKHKLRWLAQILSGLRYLHSLNLIHADIKPNNILLFPRPGTRPPFKPDDLDAKLCDYGKSRYAQSRSHTKAVPHKVAPPEYLDDLKNWTFSTTGWGVDIWSLACSIYHLHHHKYLYPEEKLTGVVIKSAVNNLPQASSLDLILKRMLTYNVKQRPTAEMLLNNFELQQYDHQIEGIFYPIDQFPLLQSECEHIHGIVWEDHREVIPYKWIETIAGRLKWAVSITEESIEWSKILQWSVMLVFEMHFDLRCYPENFRTLNDSDQTLLFNLLDVLDFRILKN